MTSLRHDMSTPRNYVSISLAVCLWFLTGLIPAVLAGPAILVTEKSPVEPETGWEFAITPQWDSRYGAEGRDVLEGNSLSSTLFTMDSEGWLVGSWFAWGEGSNYEERNFFIERGFEFAGFEAYAGYKYLQFPNEDVSEDHELSAGIAGPSLWLGLVPELNWYGSFDSGGSYLEAGISKQLILTERFHLKPSIYLGRNDGYIADGHRGIDHLRIALEFHCHLAENLTIVAHTGKSFAIDSDPCSIRGRRTPH